MPSKAVDEPEDEDRRSEGDRDRETSGTRDRPRMSSAATGHVQHPESPRDEADQRGRYRRECEGKKRGTHEEDRGGRHRGHDNDSYAFGIPALRCFLDSAPNAPSREAPGTAWPRA